MAEARRLRPGEDRKVAPSETLTVLQAVRAYKKEAEDAKLYRLNMNRRNRDAYLGRWDTSHKIPGQSVEFLPKTPMAVEQFGGFVKRALTQFGQWFDVELARGSKSPIDSFKVRALATHFLENMWTEDNVKRAFPVVLGDAVKMGSLESLMVFKVHGQMNKHGPMLGGEEMFRSWGLRIDLIKNEDYFPDPTGRGLYEIHSSMVDLHTVIERAEQGIYDKAAVEQIKENYVDDDDEPNQRRDADQNQNEATPPGFRKQVRIDEFWGDILDSDGRIVHRNVFCTIANDLHVIRPPKANPFWHGESPFVSCPLIRVPFSVWHKALMDHAVELNLAQNEMFNLIIDGGLASVWGIRQLRASDIENLDEVTDGIPQGTTLIVKETVPHGAKVAEPVITGEVPTDAMAVFEMLDREFGSAALSNQLKLGAFPSGDVKATAVIEQSQSQAVTLDSVVGDIERECIEKVLRKAWMNIVQNMDQIDAQEIADVIGPSGAFDLARMDAEDRFKMFGAPAAFSVYGISATLARVRDFQKFMALLQAVMQNPMLMMAFFRKYSPDKVLSHLMKTLNINPDQMNKSEEEISRVASDLQELQMFQQMANPPTGGNENGGGAGISAQDVGAPELPAEINQQVNPMSGMAG